jgi:hypothetical protein
VSDSPAGSTATAANAQDPRRGRALGALLFNLAFALTLWALLMDTITFTGDYTRPLVQAVACSSISLILLAIAWRSMGWIARSLSADGLMNGGGLVALDQLFSKRFEVSNQTILQAGIMISYMRDCSAHRDVKAAYSTALDRLRDQAHERYADENKKLEQALQDNEPRLGLFLRELLANPR